MERAEERGREKRLKEWDKGRAGKRLAEQQIQRRANTVRLSWDFDFDPLVLIDLLYTQRVLKDALIHWTNRIIVVKLRELEVVQRRDKAVVL